MDPKDFEAALAAARQQPVPSEALELDPALLEQAMQALSPNAAASPAAEEQPAQPEPQAATPATPPARDFSNAAGELSEEEKAHYAAADDGRVGRADAATEGLLGGAVNSVLETKDFLFGEPEDEDKSQMRQDFEDSLQATKDQGIIAGASVSIGQFAAGMYGLGKLSTAAKALPWFGKGLQSAGTALDATRTGRAGVEVAKAATVGAVAFDPHEERLANLIESGPLSNPVTRFLAADPTDSAAEGRMKAALESIGLDIAIIGTLGAGLKVYKALRNGDAEGASRAAAQGEAEARAAMADEPMPSGAGTPDDPVVLDEVVVPNQVDPEDAIREVDLEAGGLGGTEAPNFQDEWRTPTSASLVDADEDILAVRQMAEPLADPIAFATNPGSVDLDGISPAARAVEKRLLQKYGVRSVDELDNADLTDAERFFLFYDEVPTDRERLSALRDMVEPVADVDEAATELRRITGKLPADLDNMKDAEKVAVGRLLFLGSEMERLGADPMEVIERAVREQMGRYKDADDADFMAEGLMRRLASFMENPKGATSSSELPAISGPTEALPAPASPPANMVDDIEVQVAQSPTDAANAAGVDLQGTPTPSAQPAIRFSDENTDEVLKGLEADANAMETHGGWYQAIENGHTFGRGEGVPYNKLNQQADVDDFMARVVDTAEERIGAIKGGDVMSDAKVQRLVNQRAQLFNDDPASVLGMLNQSGKMAARMVADMEAGYLVTSRMLQDTYALAQRIKIGDFSEFGGREGAVTELKKRLSLASSTYAASRSITSNAGRAVRRMRKDFAINPEDVAKLQSMDSDQLVDIISATNGSPRALAKAANPSWWDKTVDFGQFLLINNLVSGPKTQLINAVTNAYMIGARPMERILGSVPGAIRGEPASRAILQEAVKQYTYTGTALREGFDIARKAFMANDSILSPHRTELYRGNQAAEAQGAMGRAWKPWNSTTNILHNALLVAGPKAIGLPTRTLGYVDELVKQTVYRSKVMAKAHMEAAEKGAASGLEGDDLKSFMRTYITDKLENSFDDMGRGLDPDAIREANIATFQQDLLPNTIGKTVQGAVNNHPGLRLILPFVKTPTNVIRYGWKMSPILNLAQTEYREMLKGAMGKEAQAQAVGQMTMGTLFMGAAAFMASQGGITGGGPKDFKLQQELKATGWQPYSLVKENADGTKTYTPYNRYDPIAIPFGIIADLQDSIAALGDEADEQSVSEHIGSAIGALFIGLSKQFTSKTYLTGISQALEAFEDPEARAGSVGGQMVANFVPFSAAMRQFNPDPHLREARGVADRIMNTIPGLSTSVPARYDAFGDPIRVQKGLWSNDRDSLVDREMVRLGLENGSAPMRVGPQPQAGVDLRDITTADGRNAYEVYQQYSGHLPNASRSLKQVVGRIMATKAYQNAPDGDIGTKGTKLNILSKPFTQYRRAALQRLKADPVVRQAFMKRQLQVRDAYREQRQQRGTARPDVGSAFGVDLGGLLSGE